MLRLEIERINENTVKFYISYLDIEDRGFEKEEIWYDRERSEQLFWQIMDEVDYKEDFVVEGPLWIQVQAMDKGLEIIVTKAKMSKDGENFEFPKEGKEQLQKTFNEKLDSFLERELIQETKKDELDSTHEFIWAMIELKSFEDVIRLSYSLNHEVRDIMKTQLFGYENKYYLYVEMQEHYMEYQDDLLSHILEFGKDSQLTNHYLEEYATEIFDSDVFERIKNNFQL